MAYDPRTGVTTYGEVDPAADPNSALNANLANADAPSTATAFAPSAPAPSSIDELYDRYYGDWRTSDMWGGAPPAPGASYDPYNMQWQGGADPRDVATRAAQAGSLEDWLFAVDQAMGQTTYDDPYNMTGRGFIGGYSPYGTYGENLIRTPLDAIAGAAGVGSVDWSPYLDQYWMSEWLDQVANNRTPEHIFSHRQGYGDTLLGVLDRAAQGLENPALMELGQENFGPGTDFYRDYNTLGNWMESRRDESRNSKAVATMLPIFTGLFAPYIAPYVSEAAGGGMLGTVAAGAAVGGLQGLATGDPVGGAVRGGLTAGVQDVAAPAVSSAASGMLERLGFDPMAVFGDDKLRGGLMPAAVPEADPTFGGALSQVGQGTYSQFSGLMPPAIPETAANLAEMGLTETSPGTFERLGAAGMIPSSSPSYDPAAASQTAPEPSVISQAARYARLGQALLGQGQTPEGAPQRGEDQSDADYAQSLASYVNVDAQALADLGLVPGTPEYYDYLMGELDKTVAGLSQGLDVDAEDLMSQLRAKTSTELDGLRRALYVRGQLGQLMGSGSYVDPLSGRAEEVITNGQRVNPGVAAYHRGLGRTIDEFADLAPVERRQAIGGMLGRDADFYGVQARADERTQQEMLAQQMLEDWKRRNRGLFGGDFF